MYFRTTTVSASAAFVIACAFSFTSHAVSIIVDYSYDSSDFFGNGNPLGPAAGAEARESLEAAASFFSGILDDSFVEIVTPPQFQSDASNGVVDWEWDLRFNDPSSGSLVTLTNETIAEGEYRLYAGARSLGSLGTGGPGGYGFRSSSSGFFSSDEIDQINSITDAFSSAVTERGDPGGFSAWGGAVSFREGATWHYDREQTVPENASDFYSVSLHEIGHSLGLNGGVDEWLAFQVGAEFQGPETLASWKADDPSSPEDATGVPTVSGTEHHWKDNGPPPNLEPMVESFVLGTTTLQEVAMDPTLIVGTRKLFTNVDAYALRDIGWTVPDSVFLVDEGLIGDLNEDGAVDAADASVLFFNWGAVPPGDPVADINSDGFVDAADAGAMFAGWTGDDLPQLVPEPVSAASILFAACILSILFRTHLPPGPS